MNSGQERFLAFFIENTRPEKQEKAKEILLQSFAQQQTKKLSMADFNELQQNLLPLIKPEKVAEVTGAMAHFSKNLS
jgi:hypothetical protein